MSPYLCHFQGAHYSSKTEHVPHGALQLGSQLDGFVEQGCPLLCAACAAQDVHSDHDGHSVKPARGKTQSRVSTGRGDALGAYTGLLLSPPLCQAGNTQGSWTRLCRAAQWAHFGHAVPYRSSRSRRSWWPWGRVSSSMPELTPMSRCVSTVTPNIRATWQGR